MKIVKNSRWAFALAIAATLAGCSADSELTGGEPNPFDPSAGVPLEINSMLEAGMETPVSRAATPAVPLTTGEIGIFLGGNETYTVRNNICYTGADGVWSARTNSQTLLLKATDANVCAYYPYAAAKTDKTRISMTTQEYNEGVLFYYAIDRAVNGTPAKRATQFAMTHAYARMRLHISRKDYPTACKITDITFNNSKLPASGTLNISTGVYTNTLGNYRFTGGGLPKTLSADETYDRDLMVVPQTGDMTEPSTVVLTVDNQQMTATIPVSQLKKFEAGKQYEINIVIQGTGIVPTVTTTDWEVKSVNGGGGYVPAPGDRPTR